MHTLSCRPMGVDGGRVCCTFVVPKTPNQQPNMPSGVGTMIDRAASLQPARAPKQQIPLAPCKGRGRFPAHEEDRLCLPTGSVGSILGKATSTTDFWNTVKQTNKQTNKSVSTAKQMNIRIARATHRSQSCSLGDEPVMHRRPGGLRAAAALCS